MVSVLHANKRGYDDIASRQHDSRRNYRWQIADSCMIFILFFGEKSQRWAWFCVQKGVYLSSLFASPSRTSKTRWRQIQRARERERARAGEDEDMRRNESHAQCTHTHLEGGDWIQRRVDMGWSMGRIRLIQFTPVFFSAFVVCWWRSKHNPRSDTPIPNT